MKIPKIFKKYKFEDLPQRRSLLLIDQGEFWWIGVTEHPKEWVEKMLHPKNINIRDIYKYESPNENIDSTLEMLKDNYKIKNYDFKDVVMKDGRTQDVYQSFQVCDLRHDHQ